jgi:hypothetical protein
VPSVAHAARPPVGAPVTGEHVPAFAGTTHDPHCPVHALLQQTPSTQKPDVHWFAPPHVAPSPSFG